MAKRLLFTNAPDLSWLCIQLSNIIVAFGLGSGQVKTKKLLESQDKLG
jgi:hypothetical protein